MLCNFLSAYSFSVNGDKTNQFILGRRVKFLYQDSGITYSTIDSSTFTGTTTEVIIRDPVLNSNVDQVLYGIVSTSPYGSLPDHGHSVDPGDGGLITIRGTSGAVSFLELLDTPSYFDDGKFLVSTQSGIGYTIVPTISGLDGTDGVDGAPGVDGIDGTTWYSGTDDPPGQELGVENDFYFNSNTYDIFKKDYLTFSTVNVFTGGTATAGNYFGTNPPANAVDDNTFTKWYGTTPSTSWWKYDLGSGNNKTVSKIDMYVIDGIRDFDIGASNDDSSWITLHTDIITSSTGQWYSFTFDNVDSYRYYRVFIYNSNNSNVRSINEIKAYEQMGYDWSLVANVKGDDGVDGINAPDSFVDLVDTPSYYDDGKFLVSTNSGIDFVSLTDFSTASGTSFTTISGMNSVNVQDAIEELYNMILALI